MQYLLAALGLAPLSGFLWAFFLRQKRTPRLIRKTIPGFSLRLSHSGGLVETLILPAGRISCGFSPDYDIDLAHYVKSGRAIGKIAVEELAFQPADGRLAVTAHSKVMMNGVERTSGSIPVNGSLLYRNCRFTFLGQVELQKEESVLPGYSTLVKLTVVPAATTLAAVILLVFGLADLGTSGYFKRLAARPSIVVEQEARAVPSAAASSDPSTLLPKPVAPSPVTPPAPPETNPDPTPVRLPVVVPLRSAVRAEPEPIRPVLERSTPPAVAQKKVIVPLRSTVRPEPEPIRPVLERRIAPAVASPEPLPETEIAVVLPPRVESRLKRDPEPKPAPAPESRPSPAPYPAPLTVRPGESLPETKVDILFIHAHPDDESLDYGALIALCREAGLTSATVLLTDGEGGIYQQDYSGPRNDMPSTRIQEAARALQFLGSSIYIRLGLKNNPYNSLLEEKGVQEVLRLWDGDAVAVRLAGIIKTLRPRVIVSPEGPSIAREHFEHETTGVLTLMALQQLRLTGGHLPEAHLVSIDPRQKDAYTGLISFPRRQVMEKQRQALLSHASQADAAYFGIQIIEKYSEEYYLIQYWDIAVHFTRFFGLVSASTVPAPGPDSPLMTSSENGRQTAGL